MWGTSPMVNSRNRPKLRTMIRRFITYCLLLGTATGCLRPPMNPLHQRVGADQVTEQSLNTSARMDRIQNLLADGFYDDARAALDLVIADGLEHPRAFFMLGEVSAYQAKYDEALGWLARSVQMSPTWAKPRLLQARVYIELDRLTAAKQVFSSLETLFPRHPAGPYGKGWIALIHNQPAAAAAAFTESLKRNPQFSPAIAGQARIARAQGDLSTERHLLGRYIVLRPMDPYGHNRMAQIDLEEGLLTSAQRGFKRVYQLRPSRETAEALRLIAIQLGDHEAEQLWEARAQ